MANRSQLHAGIFSLIAASLCATSFAQEPAASLYARLGGATVVDALVNDTVDAVASTNDSRQMKDLLRGQICSLTGGGCADLGDSGHTVLDAPHIEALRASMRAHQVPIAARNELLEILAPMTRIVARR